MVKHGCIKRPIEWPRIKWSHIEFFRATPKKTPPIPRQSRQSSGLNVAEGWEEKERLWQLGFRSGAPVLRNTGKKTRGKKPEIQKKKQETLFLDFSIPQHKHNKLHHTRKPMMLHEQLEPMFGECLLFFRLWLSSEAFLIYHNSCFCDWEDMTHKSSTSMQSSRERKGKGAQIQAPQVISPFLFLKETKLSLVFQGSRAGRGDPWRS